LWTSSPDNIPTETSYAILQAMSAITRLPEITERIVNASQPEKIILFGSHARGDFGPDSDLDLLVVIRGVKHLRAEGTRLRGALRGLLVPVDIVVATPEQMERLGDVPGMVYRTALKEGKVVYERAGA
jgi:predicted nucleotidyltransferase